MKKEKALKLQMLGRQYRDGSPDTHKLYESPSRDQNIKKYGHLATHQCICCMKPLKEDHNLCVHMNTRWLAVSNEVTSDNCEELTGAESQGCFEIGNDCAKKMPKNFLITFDK